MEKSANSKVVREKSGKMEKVREKSWEVKSGVFFQVLNTPKLVFRPPAGRVYDAPPNLPVGWGGGHPIPFPSFFGQR